MFSTALPSTGKAEHMMTKLIYSFEDMVGKTVASVEKKADRNLQEASVELRFTDDTAAVIEFKVSKGHAGVAFKGRWPA